MNSLISKLPASDFVVFRRRIIWIYRENVFETLSPMGKFRFRTKMLSRSPSAFPYSRGCCRACVICTDSDQKVRGSFKRRTNRSVEEAG